MLGDLANRALHLTQRSLGPIRGLGQGRSERADQEPVGVLLERKRRGLAQAADNSPGGAREALQMLGFAAYRAGRELRNDPGREQQLEPKRQSVRSPGLSG